MAGTMNVPAAACSPSVSGGRRSRGGAGPVEPLASLSSASHSPAGPLVH